MITLADYLGPHTKSPDLTTERYIHINHLLDACAALEEEMVADGVEFLINPATGTGVSGQTLGGFRPQNTSTGAPRSAHKEGMAVDRYDPKNEIDDWLMAHPEALSKHGIYIEHPDDTPRWSHWSIKRPGSGKHIFKP